MTSTGIKTRVPQPTSGSWTRAGGLSETQPYEGVNESDFVALTLELRNNGWEYTYSKEPGMWKVNATRGAIRTTSGGTELQDQTVTPLSETWEMMDNAAEKEILESYSPLMQELYTSSGSQGAFETYVEGLRQYQADTKLNINQFNTGAGATAATKIARLLRAGITTASFNYPALRHTKIVSDKYAIKAALTNCGKIIKASTINALESVPADLLFILPSGYDSGRDDALGVLLKYGWLKKHPNITSQAEATWQISQDYQWGLWHTDLYEFA
jgi:hypothetical protein